MIATLMPLVKTLQVLLPAFVNKVFKYNRILIIRLKSLHLFKFFKKVLLETEELIVTKLVMNLVFMGLVLPTLFANVI
jgi:hypothetical protein